MTSILLIGNGKLPGNARALIESADIVCRFNLPPREHEEFGYKTSVLYLATTAKQIGREIVSGRLAGNRFFQEAREIVFPYNPEVAARYLKRPNWLSLLKGRRADWSGDCAKICLSSGKSLRAVSTQNYEDICKALGIDVSAKNLFPSSGVLALFDVLNAGTEVRVPVHMIGFGFAGWKRHAWAMEEAYVKSQSALGRVAVLG
ncbi:hypothetical protein ACSV9I_00745 [Rhizobium sp. G187]|uniref:hypothetical protein n=1 Tax=Rhizobium sp. G187 TaxID=3451352 RepID=UPI003EE650E7